MEYPFVAVWIGLLVGFCLGLLANRILGIFKPARQGGNGRR